MIDMLVYMYHQQVMRVIYKYQIVFYLVWLVGFFLGLSGRSNSLGWVFYLQLVDFTCNKNSLYLVSSQSLSKDVSKESIILHGFDSSTQTLMFVGDECLWISWVPLIHKWKSPQMYNKEKNCLTLMQQTSYPRNEIPTNQQNVNHPLTLAPTNENDSTVCHYWGTLHKPVSKSSMLTWML